jgi:hypothetical protein
MQTVEDAESVVQTFQVVSGCSERVAATLTDDKDRTTVAKKAPAGAEHLDWVRHIVKRLVRVHEVRRSVL